MTIQGNGEKVLLFAHGFGCDQNSWKFIVDAFLDDYKVVLFDYVGSGKSDVTAYDQKKYSTLDGYAQDILDICKELNLHNVTFVGHSVSSMIGVLAANKEPFYFSKLIFLGPSPCYINYEGYAGGFEKKDLDSLFEFMESNYLGWSQAMAPAIMGNKNRPELGEFLTSSFCSTNPEIANQFARVTFLSDNRQDLNQLQVESVSLQCQEDIIAPLAVGEFIQRNTKNNRLVVMNATGHCPHISEPKETIELIKEYI